MLDDATLLTLLREGSIDEVGYTPEANEVCVTFIPPGGAYTDRQIWVATPKEARDFLEREVVERNGSVERILRMLP